MPSWRRLLAQDARLAAARLAWMAGINSATKIADDRDDDQQLDEREAGPTLAATKSRGWRSDTVHSRMPPVVSIASVSHCLWVEQLPLILGDPANIAPQSNRRIVHRLRHGRDSADTRSAGRCIAPHDIVGRVDDAVAVAVRAVADCHRPAKVGFPFVVVGRLDKSVAVVVAKEERRRVDAGDAAELRLHVEQHLRRPAAEVVAQDGAAVVGRIGEPQHGDDEISVAVDRDIGRIITGEVGARRQRIGNRRWNHRELGWVLSILVEPQDLVAEQIDDQQVAARQEQQRAGASAVRPIAVE